MDKVWILVALFGLAAAGAVIGLAFFSFRGDERSPTAGPRLTIEGRYFDLGDVPADEIVEREIAFTNSGEEPLDVSIVKVRPAPDAACGCGVESFEVRPETVLPGQSGELVFMLRVPEGMPEMEDRMLAELKTNDPEKPSLTISLTFRMAD